MTVFTLLISQTNTLIYIYHNYLSGDENIRIPSWTYNNQRSILSFKNCRCTFYVNISNQSSHIDNIRHTCIDLSLRLSFVFKLSRCRRRWFGNSSSNDAYGGVVKLHTDSLWYTRSNGLDTVLYNSQITDKYNIYPHIIYIHIVLHCIVLWRLNTKADIAASVQA